MKDFLEKNLNDAPMLGAFVNQSDEIKVEGFELIKVEERDGKQAINARELHQKLTVSKSLRIGFEIVLKSTDSLKIKTFLHLIILSNEKKAVVFAKSMPFHWIWRRSCA